MGVRRVEDLRAWQRAHEFKLEVYRLVNASKTASRDYRYRDQLFDAASAVESDIGEGFRRRGARVFGQFLGYALGSLEEAQIRVKDGVDCRHFSLADCERALRLGEDCGRYTSNLQSSLEPFFGQGPLSARAPARTPDSPDSSDSSDSSDSPDSY